MVASGSFASSSSPPCYVRLPSDTHRGTEGLDYGHGAGVSDVGPSLAPPYRSTCPPLARYGAMCRCARKRLASQTPSPGTGRPLSVPFHRLTRRGRGQAHPNLTVRKLSGTNQPPARLRTPGGIVSERRAASSRNARAASSRNARAASSESAAERQDVSIDQIKLSLSTQNFTLWRRGADPTEHPEAAKPSGRRARRKRRHRAMADLAINAVLTPTAAQPHCDTEQEAVWRDLSSCGRVPLQYIPRGAGHGPHNTGGSVIKFDLATDGLLYHRGDDHIAEAAPLRP